MPRRYDQTQLEVKVFNIELLADVREKMAKSLTIRVGYKEVTTEWLDRIEGMVQNYAGKCQLKMLVEDMGENNRVMMRAKTARINPSNELLAELKELGIPFKLN